MNLGEWVKEVKKALIDMDMSVTELSKKLGYSRAWVYMTLGEVNPSQKVINEISEITGVKPYEID